MAKTGTYNGKPILILDPDVKHPALPFSFGAAKARVILKNMKEIENFLIGTDTDMTSRPSKIESIRNKQKRPQLDLTPEINETGKKFMISKYKARLIMRHSKDIEEFVKNIDEKFSDKIRQETELHKYVRCHTSDGIKNPWDPETKKEKRKYL